MRVLDTNILIYAYAPGEPKQAAAAKLLTAMANGRQPWGLTAASVAEFLRATTHPNIGMRWTPAEACQVMDELCASPSMRLLAPQEGYWDVLGALVRKHRLAGNRVFDAQIAAICLQHGASEIVTEDKSFVAVPHLRRVALKDAI